MHVAYIGLGSNMGDKVGNINKAIAALGKISGNKVLAVSSFYETEPVGNIEQDWFINTAVTIETGLTPGELLDILLKIEKELGRVRDARWGPRVIDLDILLYDDLVLNEEGLVIPHPYLHERRFVLAPLAEIAPELMHPLLKKSMSELLKGLHDSKKIKKSQEDKVMKKTLLLLFLCILITITGCRKKEEAGSEDVGGGNVQALQDISQIEAQYKDAIAKDPRNYEATVGLGNHYFDAGQPEKAIEMYQKALEINPNDANVRTDMGTMYRRIGNFDKAVEAFRKSASIDPKHEQSRYNLGVTLYQDKNDLKGAADAWEELLKINPNHPNAEGLKEAISQAKNQQTPESKSPSSGWVK